MALVGANEKEDWRVRGRVDGVKEGKNAQGIFSEEGWDASSGRGRERRTSRGTTGLGRVMMREDWSLGVGMVFKVGKSSSVD
jgi:hypothetical protein